MFALNDKQHHDNVYMSFMYNACTFGHTGPGTSCVIYGIVRKFWCHINPPDPKDDTEVDLLEQGSDRRHSSEYNAVMVCWTSFATFAFHPLKMICSDMSPVIYGHKVFPVLLYFV